MKQKKKREMIDTCAGEMFIYIYHTKDFVWRPQNGIIKSKRDRKADSI